MIWTLLGGFGLYFGWVNLRNSRRNLEALHEMNGQTFATYRIMRVIAYGHYRNNLFRFAKHLTVFAIGIVSMLLPNFKVTGTGGHSQNIVSYTQVVVTGGLFTIVLLLIMASVLDRRQTEALEALE